jgi:hypothetical protein
MRSDLPRRTDFRFFGTQFPFAQDCDAVWLDARLDFTPVKAWDVSANANTILGF